MSPYLYINSKGQPHTRHSYSAGNTWDNCQYFYYLEKILGYKKKDSLARFAYGKALEESIQYHTEHDGIGAVEDFVRRWSIYKDAGLSYTATEKDWTTLNQVGQDHVRLFHALLPSLPIYPGGRSIWQREYEKEVFPGDINYGGIVDAGRLDLISYADPDHPSLPKMDWKPEYGPYRPVIIDLKTAGQELAEQPGIVAFDSQLKRYSWQTGIRTVALLWFVKKALGFKKGYSITVLESVGSFKPGEDAIIAKLEDTNAWILKTDFMLEEMNRVQGKTDGSEERGMTFLQQYGVKVPLHAITKQKLQFAAGVVSQESADDAGRTAARQIVEIVNAHKTKTYAHNYGIRYPRDSRNDPYFRAFVLQDEQFKKQNFTRSDEEAFEDLFNEDTE